MTALPRRQRLKVLVADDDAIARRVIVATLAPTYDIVEAADGLTAARLFVETSPDVVVMDVDMPGATGAEAAAAMRALETERYVPILLVSALDDLNSVVASLSTGADDFLPKPFNPRLFDSKLRVFLRLREMQERLREQNGELSRFREETQREQQLAQQVVERLGRRGSLDDERVVVSASSLGMLSGDMVWGTRLPDGAFRWFLCDVAGHGLSGALGTVPVAVLMCECTRRGDSLATVVELINDELKALLPTSLFASAAFFELDPTRRSLSIVNAGVADVLIARATGLERVPASALPLGIARAPTFDAAPFVMAVEPGDIVWALSDGIVEAASPLHETFGAARVEALLAARRLSDAHALTAAVRAFTEGTQRDDESLIGVLV